MARHMVRFLAGTGLLPWPALLVTGLAFLSGGALGLFNAAQLPPPVAAQLQSWLEGSMTAPDFEKALVSSMSQYAVTVAALYLVGLTAVGIPLLLLILFLRGLAVGFTVAFLVREMSWRGIYLALTCLLPPALLYFPTLVAAGAAALTFALLVLRHCYRGGASLWPCFLSYSALMLVMELSGLGAGLMAAVLPVVALRWL